jgi:hypothetical protein
MFHKRKGSEDYRYDVFIYGIRSQIQGLTVMIVRLKIFERGEWIIFSKCLKAQGGEISPVVYAVVRCPSMKC